MIFENKCWIKIVIPWKGLKWSQKQVHILISTYSISRLSKPLSFNSGQNFSSKSSKSIPFGHNWGLKTIWSPSYDLENALRWVKMALNIVVSARQFYFYKLQKKIYVTDSMAELAGLPENISSGVWKNRFWRNFGRAFFLQ